MVNQLTCNVHFFWTPTGPGLSRQLMPVFVNMFNFSAASHFSPLMLPVLFLQLNALPSDKEGAAKDGHMSPTQSPRVRQSSSGNTMLDQLLQDMSNQYVKYVDEVRFRKQSCKHSY